MAAQRAWLRLWHDLLAALAGLEQRRCVATPARGPAGGTARERQTRPDAGSSGLESCAGAQGRPKTGRSPVDRGRLGSKHHLITDAGGVPLAVLLTGGVGDQ